MSLPGFSVRNPVAVNLLMWSVIAGGLVSAVTLTREFFPAFDTNLITVTVPYPGASPSETEEGICSKVEEAIRSIVGMTLALNGHSKSNHMMNVTLAVGGPSLMASSTV